MQIAEKPILVSGPLIGPIRRDTKTQTRRIVNMRPEAKFIPDGSLDFNLSMVEWKENIYSPEAFLNFCPYGREGDRLWVRETHGVNKHTGEVSYLADGGWAEAAGFKESAFASKKWTPSIHMKRIHSRIDLEITDIRIQRIQDISPEDAYAEGLGKITKDNGITWKYGMADRDGLPGNDNYGWPWDQWETDPVAAFRKLWDKINADRGFGWDANPWVWALSFKRIRG